jgi:hypothetical protein
VYSTAGWRMVGKKRRRGWAPVTPQGTSNNTWGSRHYQAPGGEGLTGVHCWAVLVDSWMGGGMLQQVPPINVTLGPTGPPELGWAHIHIQNCEWLF